MAHPLQKAIDALGWTQSELSRRSGVAQPTLSYVLGGKRGGRFSAESARKILGVVKPAHARAAELGSRARQVPPITLADLVFPPPTRAGRNGRAS